MPMILDRRGRAIYNQCTAIRTILRDRVNVE